MTRMTAIVVSVLIVAPAMAETESRYAVCMSYCMGEEGNSFAICHEICSDSGGTSTPPLAFGEPEDKPNCGAAINMRSAELTGAGESVQVRREGKANHYFHRKPCGRTREGAVEASVAARVAGMIEHRKRYDPERRGFLIDRRQHLQSRHGEGLPGSALSEESRDARTPLYRDSGGLQFASAVVPGPRKKGDNPNR